jgi:hypothetical protein
MLLKARRILATIVQVVLPISILATMAIMGSCSYLLNREMNEALKPVTDSSQYEESLAKFEGSLTVKHFPPKIPADAKNVRLYYLPGFLQGATLLELRMKLPPDKIKTIEAEFLKQAKRKYIPGAKDNSPTEEDSPTGLKVEYSYRSHIGSLNGKNFPSNYKILVLEDTRGAPKYDWNHSDVYGVAIDPANSEVVYWLEDW